MAARAPVSACRPQSMMNRPSSLGRIDPNSARPSASTSEQLVGSSASITVTAADCDAVIGT